MPSYKVSAVVAYILCSEFREGNGHAFQELNVLKILGLASPPSTSGVQSVPRGIPDIATSQDIAEFLEEARKTPDGDRLDWLTNGEECQKGRRAWEHWYRFHLANRLNLAIDEALRAQEVHPMDLLAERIEDTIFPESTVVALHGTPCVAELFGNALYQGRLPTAAAQAAVSSLISHTCSRLNKRYSRARRAVLGEVTPNAPAQDKGKEPIWTQLQEVMLQIDVPDAPQDAIVDHKALKKAIRLMRLLTSKRDYIGWCPSIRGQLDICEAVIRGIADNEGLSLARTRRRVPDADTDEAVAAARKRGARMKLGRGSSSDPKAISALKSVILDHFRHLQERESQEIQTLDDVDLMFDEAENVL